MYEFNDIRIAWLNSCSDSNLVSVGLLSIRIAWGEQRRHTMYWNQFGRELNLGKQWRDNGRQVLPPFDIIPVIAYAASNGSEGEALHAQHLQHRMEEAARAIAQPPVSTCSTVQTAPPFDFDLLLASSKPFLDLCLSLEGIRSELREMQSVLVHSTGD